MNPKLGLISTFKSKVQRIDPRVSLPKEFATKRMISVARRSLTRYRKETPNTKAEDRTMRTYAPLQDTTLWHRWFAWFPVQVGNTRVWWETVWRRDSSACPALVGRFWVYRVHNGR